MSFCLIPAQGTTVFNFLSPPSVIDRELWIKAFWIPFSFLSFYLLVGFRFTVLEKFLVIVFCSPPLIFASGVPQVLFPLPFSLKLILDFHLFNHYQGHSAAHGQTCVSTLCTTVIHMTLISSAFWVFFIWLNNSKILI